MLVSVVIPCMNRVAIVGETLRALSAQSIDHDGLEVILVDDGSTDGLMSFVDTIALPYRFRCIQTNRVGPARARNEGARHSAAPLVVFLDCDVVPESECLAAHLAAQSNLEHGIVVGRIRSGWSAETQWFETVVQPDIGLDRGEHARDLRWYEVLAGNMSIGAEWFDSLGGFSERYAYGGEEIELAYRSVMAGGSSIYSPSAVSEHRHPRTLSQRCEQARRYSRPLAKMLADYPEVETEIPGIYEYYPLCSRPIGPRILVRRLIKGFYGNYLIRGLLYGVVRLLAHRQILARSVRSTYWRLMAGEARAGFHEAYRFKNARESYNQKLWIGPKA